MPVPGGETMCDGAACEEPVAAWDVATVCAWAQENKIPEFAVLARSEDIDGPVLLTIEHSDLRAEPLAAALKEAGVSKFGQMRRLELALEKIRNRRGGGTAKRHRRTRPALSATYPTAPCLIMPFQESQHHQRTTRPARPLTVAHPAPTWSRASTTSPGSTDVPCRRVR